jgi:hypothetical protein
MRTGSPAPPRDGTGADCPEVRFPGPVGLAGEAR